MNSLDSPDIHYLSAAIGWLELGNWREASEELERITPALSAHPAVSAVRLEICMKAEKWDKAVEIARALIQLHPNEAQFWISHAYATRRMPGGGIAQAKEILDKAEPMFPKVWTIPYNLACYCAQLGRLDECHAWFSKATALDEKTVKRTAIDDPDLKPYWDSTASTLWKRTE
ncbi:MAG TPA: tetratricopeptide repeat protein [Verrucomicrobiae bacterium]|nr:tetratricopeptide repeat protein [Verrucomicrobiae bacterium]